MYETRDANFKNLMFIAGGLVVLVVVTMLVVRGLLGLFGAHTEHPGAFPATFATPDNRAPEPRLQSDPPADLASMRRGEDSVLESYGWVNRDSGIVRVPIDRAMVMLIKKGLPTRTSEPAESKEKNP